MTYIFFAIAIFAGGRWLGKKLYTLRRTKYVDADTGEDVTDDYLAQQNRWKG